MSVRLKINESSWSLWALRDLGFHRERERERERESEGSIGNSGNESMEIELISYLLILD